MFRKVVSFVLLLVLLVFALGKTKAPVEVLVAKQSVVMLGYYNDDNIFVRNCSGAFLEGKIVTAGHCVYDNLHPFIQTADGKIFTSSVIRVASGWPAWDYAVLDSPIDSIYPSLKRSETPMAVGDALYVWSGPWGLGRLLIDGIYAGRVSDDPSIPQEIRGMHYADINVAGGSSGSIVLNEEGEAVAILVGGFGEDSRTLRLTGALLVELPWKE